MHYKKLSIVTSLILIAITLFVACMSNDKKSNKKSDSSAAAQQQPASDTFKVRPLMDIKYEVTSQRLKQGEYLSNSILMCFSCHSPRDWKAPGAPPIEERKGSGGTIIYEDSSSLVMAPNITPDKETGAGKWTDDMLARAIREGVGHDGRALSREMPYNVFRKVSDEDLASVIVYLRSLPAVHNVVSPAKIPSWERSQIEKSLRPITQPIAVPDFSNQEKRGKYLVSIGECVGCHTSHAEYNPGLLGGGNFLSRFGHSAFSANITSDASGIPYGEQGFIFVLRTGKGATLSPAMPWIAFKNMTDDDIKAIYSYLRTIPHAHHSVNNQKPFTRCAICEQDHGLGEKNKREKPDGIKPNPKSYELYEGKYFNEGYGITSTIIRSGDKLIFQPWENGPKLELIPQSETHFLAPGWILPVHFVKDENGLVTEMVEESGEGGVYKRIN